MTRRAREVWRPVVGFDAYEVSTLGRVRRVKLGENGAPCKVLKPWAGLGGQTFVALRRKGRTHRMSVRVLMFVAFSEAELPL